tara:strand:- start:456 stop:1421 length:966 start_codon:yes stop_codon:yes gene_type:complete
MISRKSEYEREIVDRDAVEQAVQAAMASAGVGQLNLGSLGTSGQSVMEGEPMTLAPVFDKNDVAGSLAAGLVPTQKDIADIYAPYILGSKNPEKTFNEVRLLEEAGYPLIIDGKQYAPTSTISIQDGRFIPKTSGLTESKSPMSTMVEPEVTPMDSDIDRAVAAAVASAVASGGGMPVQAADDPVMAAVEAAVGSGQPTTDDTILTEQAMTSVPTETTQVAQESQPDFMTQLQELIASAQAEQTAAAEQAAAAEKQRQEQVAAMTQNYMVGQPAVGYNPYESGQYQNNPYGPAGVPAMGGITTIPVPTAYNPNPYPLGGMT